MATQGAAQGSAQGFKAKYGPWAVIAGASEGTGRAYARQLAEKGFHLVLVARREAPLLALAAELKATYGTQCLPVPLDLANPEAPARLFAAVGAREVGLYIGNVGSDPNGERFLSRPASAWLALLSRNLMANVACCHHFGAAMVARGRGGILLANSYVCYGGGSFLTTYAASKAALLLFAEGLWAEWRKKGVDVLTIVMPATNTPELQRLLAKSNLPMPQDAAPPEAVAAFGLANLSHGPVQNFGLKSTDAGPLPQSADALRQRVLAYEQMKSAFFGNR